MTESEARALVARIINLSAFADSSGIPLRTLRRFRNETRPPRACTLLALREALARYRPAMVPATKGK